MALLRSVGEMELSTFDAVIIGSGINGLAAAVHLARRGWRVAVVEKANHAGGAVRTEELTLPGFKHDLFAMNVSMFAGSAFYKEHQADLVRHGLEFVPAINSFASAFANGTWLGVNTSLDETCARIARFAPEDADKWREIAEAFPTEAPYIGGILGTPMPSYALLRLLIKAWREKGMAWLLKIVRMLLSSPRNYIDPLFEAAEVRALLAAWGMHLDFSPDVAGGAIFPYLEAMSCQHFGMVIGKGGADTLIRAMVGVLEENGGTLMLGCEAKQIIEDQNKAVGVLLADGRTLNAKRAVIANVHPRHLVSKLAPHLDPKFSKAALKFRPGPATMMIHLALNRHLDWRAGEELKNFAYVHLAPDYNVMSSAYQEALAGLLPGEPVLVVGQPTALDASRAPVDKHVLWVQVRTLPYDIKGDASGVITAKNWDEAGAAYAERVIDIIERYAPSLRQSILDMAVLTPFDLERQNPNLVNGDSLSGSHHLDQNFLFRPFSGWSRWTTPLQNLYMVGASTWPGAGTGAGSGFMLAKKLAK